MSDRLAMPRQRILRLAEANGTELEKELSAYLHDVMSVFYQSINLDDGPPPKPFPPLHRFMMHAVAFESSDEDGEGTTTRLARICRVSERRARRILHDLHAAGWVLEREGRFELDDEKLYAVLRSRGATH